MCLHKLSHKSNNNNKNTFILNTQEQRSNIALRLYMYIKNSCTSNVSNIYTYNHGHLSKKVIHHINITQIPVLKYV